MWRASQQARCYTEKTPLHGAQSGFTISWRLTPNGWTAGLYEALPCEWQVLRLAIWS